MKDENKTMEKENIIPDVKPLRVVKNGEPAEDAKIYLGPTLKGVISGTVFGGGLPQMLQEAIKDVPAIAELVVPLSGLVEASRELTNKNSALNKFYDMAEKYRKGE